MKKITGKYMMATTAIHQIGDISRDDPDFCWITGDDGVNYIGQWVEGFGFVNVRFPRSTTRELTDEEQTRVDQISTRVLKR